MQKILNVAWKDLLVVFRDRAALILMLVTPFALTLVIGLAFGGMGGGSASGDLNNIPVVIVNHDSGEMGDSLVELFGSDDLNGLVAPTLVEDDATARTMVDKDESAAAVIIPAGLTERIIPSAASQHDPQEAPPAEIEVYANPGRPISASVARAVVDEFLATVSGSTAGAQVTIEQMIQSGRLDPAGAEAAGREIGGRLGQSMTDEKLIELRQETTAEGNESGAFNWAAYMAPSMAIMFLMFTVSAGGRSILAERQGGTLPRMLVSPTHSWEVLGGKVLGIFMTGLMQMLTLLLASWLVFRMSWGAPLPVLLLILALVLGATGWGVLLAAYAKSPGQANAAGTALALLFGAAAGNFVPRQVMPTWLQQASYITPNAWGLEGFIKLMAGGGLQDVLVPVLALLAMSILLFSVAVMAFGRQYK